MVLKKTRSELCQIGLDFFEYLKETGRTSITDRVQLRDVYNEEFRSRTPGTRDPNFGSVLHALKVSGRITRRRDTIRFTSRVQALYVDQWHRPRPQQGPNGPAETQTLTPPDEAETGVRARRKLASLLMTSLKKNRSQFIIDKHGVSITCDHGFDNGKLDLCVENTYEYVVNLSVENRGTEPMYFVYYTPLQWLNYLTLTDEFKVTKTNPLMLEPGRSYEVSVHLRCSLIGFYRATLAFEFKADLQPSTASFHIIRFIDAQYMTSLGKELAPTEPYKPRALPAWTPPVGCAIVDGIRPEGFSVMHLENVVELKKYRIPAYMNQLLKTLKHSPPLHDKRVALLESPLSCDNYTEKMQLLLFLEELQMEVDIRRYNIPNEDRKHATMERDKANKKLLVLEVPGVSENRPSVLRGDELLVFPEGETTVKYRGYVHSVQRDTIKLGLSSQLLDRFVEGMKFNVEFTVNRLPLRVQHRAAELATTCGLGQVLFPTAPTHEVTEPPHLSLFDWQLEMNQEQYGAVRHIVAGSSKPAPYLVFGPPGTGKTVTVVEAIKQIEKTQTSCHILACAPSNSAADLLCKKILDHVDQHKVYRMYASSRDPKLVPDELKACSNLVGECYEYPPKQELMQFRIMVTTLLTAGRLVSGGFPPGHFTHVFVDEAGHAVETECLVPLAGLLHVGTGQLVLAGDHKQLGPILRSPFAIQYGLGVSLLERMMKDFPLYQKDHDTFNSRFVTKLLRNYRSHPDILKVPNELYYDGELQCCANEVLRNSYCRWEHLPQRDFPLIFHGVTGLDERESSSPSFFNRAEVEILIQYVTKLLQTDGKKGVAKMAAKDIGIIAPYRKQVQKIRQALDKVGKTFRFLDMNMLKVGSVEEFQGQERRVILVSTVRSSPDYADFDQQFNLGFVKNEKRFNVAVTRAKALLIVVGNPRVLRTDRTWSHFIQFCSDGGGYCGACYHDDEDEVESVVMRLSALYVDMKPAVETDESVVQQQLDPEWRNDL